MIDNITFWDIRFYYANKVKDVFLFINIPKTYRSQKHMQRRIYMNKLFSKRLFHSKQGDTDARDY